MDEKEQRYKAVRAKIDSGMGVVQAIKAVAKDMKLSSGTIQAAYYQIAAKNGKTRGTKTQMIREQARELNSNPEIMLRSVTDAVREIVVRNQELERDNARLRQIEDILTH